MLNDQLMVQTDKIGRKNIQFQAFFKKQFLILVKNELIEAPRKIVKILEKKIRKKSSHSY